MMLTKELDNAIDIVCGACPYIPEGNVSAKYCDRCMVRLMYNLYDAMDSVGGELPDSSPEWQAIINY